MVESAHNIGQPSYHGLRTLSQSEKTYRFVRGFGDDLANMTELMNNRDHI